MQFLCGTAVSFLGIQNMNKTYTWYAKSQVDDYAVTAEAEGVRDTAAIRVAATLIPEGITGSPEEQRENGPRRKALFVGISYAGTSS